MAYLEPNTTFHILSTQGIKHLPIIIDIWILFALIADFIPFAKINFNRMFSSSLYNIILIK